jgi:hypothetical protein
MGANLNGAATELDARRNPLFWDCRKIAPPGQKIWNPPRIGVLGSVAPTGMKPGLGRFLYPIHGFYSLLVSVTRRNAERRPTHGLAGDPGFIPFGCALPTGFPPPARGAPGTDRDSAERSKPRPADPGHDPLWKGGHPFNFKKCSFCEIILAWVCCNFIFRSLIHKSLSGSLT